MVSRLSGDLQRGTVLSAVCNIGFVSVCLKSSVLTSYNTTCLLVRSIKEAKIALP
jgi:hypothetical protein